MLIATCKGTTEGQTLMKVAHIYRLRRPLDDILIESLTKEKENLIHIVNYIAENEE